MATPLVETVTLKGANGATLANVVRGIVIFVLAFLTVYSMIMELFITLTCIDRFMIMVSIM